MAELQYPPYLSQKILQAFSILRNIVTQAQIKPWHDVVFTTVAPQAVAMLAHSCT